MIELWLVSATASVVRHAFPFSVDQANLPACTVNTAVNRFHFLTVDLFKIFHKNCFGVSYSFLSFSDIAFN